MDRCIQKCRRLTNCSLQPFDAYLVFERDRKAMERTVGLPGLFQIIVKLLGTLESTLDKDFRQAVDLVIRGISY